LPDLGSQVAGLSALTEPARRALYLYVVGQPEPVSRDQAADGVDLPRHTVKFHLDKLVDEGLLDTEFRRLSGRRGPGAGRPTKLYRRSALQVAVTIPARHYDLAGQILAAAIEAAAADGVPVLEAVRAAASEAGRRLGVRGGGRGGGGDRSSVEEVATVLAELGYEPHPHGTAITLANCPFHALAREHTTLVCAMNLHLIDAVLDEIGDHGLRAGLDPAPARCCVRLTSQAGSIPPGGDGVGDRSG
jgi:predicted ArsR family transcriptional regulator